MFTCNRINNRRPICQIEEISCHDFAKSRYANRESRGSQSRLRRLRDACRWLPLFLELPDGGGASRPRKVVHYLQPSADTITGLFARRSFIYFFYSLSFFSLLRSFCFSVRESIARSRSFSRDKYRRDCQIGDSGNVYRFVLMNFTETEEEQEDHEAIRAPNARYRLIIIYILVNYIFEL